MKLIINGEEKDFTERNITLGKLLEKLEISDKVMAAAVNMEIVKQDKWDTHPLYDSDKLELLDFVGGG